MDYKKLSVGLGLFSLALGAAEILLPRKITRALDSEGQEGTVRAFGGRAVVAGLGILAQPAHSATVWNRVAGDAMDLGALGLAARKAPANKAVWGAIALVVGATLIDMITARGLDAQTGKTSPRREHASA